MLLITVAKKHNTEEKKKKNSVYKYRRRSDSQKSCSLVEKKRKCMVPCVDYSYEPIRKGMVSNLCDDKNDITLFTSGTRTHIKNYLVLNLNEMKFQTYLDNYRDSNYSKYNTRYLPEVV